MPTGMNKPDSLSSVDNRYDGSLLTDTYYTRYIALEVTARTSAGIAETKRVLVSCFFTFGDKIP